MIQERPAIGEKGRTINSLYVRARFVYNAINTFVASADPQITDEHVEDATGQYALTAQEKLVRHADLKTIVHSYPLEFGC